MISNRELFCSIADHSALTIYCEKLAYFSRSAFMFFAKEERPAVLKANPSWKVPEVGKELGRRWAKCGDKAKFEALAAADKARYEEDMKKYKK